MTKRILILQRKDIANPYSGGGVRVLHKIAKKLVEYGNDVTWISGNFKGGSKSDIIDGISIIRLQSGIILFFCLIFNHFNKLRHDFDLVIEAMTPIPFFTTIFMKNLKIIAVIYHLANNAIFMAGENNLSFLINIPIRVLERLIPIFYKNTPILTFSSTAKCELIDYGINENNIFLAQEGINLKKLKPMKKKSSYPHILHVGRIVKYKGIQYIIKCLLIIKKEIPNIKFSIVGTGPYKSKLQELIKVLDLEDNVFFHGYVSETKKIELLSEAHLLIMTSIKEGWATPVIEANACGTISIGFDVPGTRETIINRETGFLIPYGNINRLAFCCLKLLKNNSLREKMELKGIGWANNFNIENLEHKSIEMINTILYSKKNDSE